MIISLIAAVSRNKVIGLNNQLPWHLPDDMKYFMKTTSGHPVIMGRKNFESIPEKFRPLPNRENIIITRQTNYTAQGCTVTHHPAEALKAAEVSGNPEVFIIGGAEIYRSYLPLADKLYITEIHAEIAGDTFFPTWKSEEWKETSRVCHPKDDRHHFEFDFVVFEKINSH